MAAQIPRWAGAVIDKEAKKTLKAVKKYKLYKQDVDCRVTCTQKKNKGEKR